MIAVTLPIYMLLGKRTVKNQLVGMNWYRDAHYHTQDSVKKHYSALIAEAVGRVTFPPMTQFQTQYTVWLKNPNSDPANVVAVFEKFWLDALQDCGVIVQDSANYHLGSAWENAGIDRQNPRIVCAVSTCSK